MSGSEDGQLRSPLSVERQPPPEQQQAQRKRISFNEDDNEDDDHDTDSLDIKPPQAIYTSSGGSARRKEKTASNNKHSSKDHRRPGEREHRREKDSNHRREMRIGRGDEQHSRRSNGMEGYHLVDLLGGGGSGRGGEERERERRYHHHHHHRYEQHRAMHHHHSYQQQLQQQHHHHMQQQQQRHIMHDYEYHHGSDSSASRHRHHHRQKYIEGSNGNNNSDLQHEALAHDKDAESLEQDLRSRLLSKRHKYVKEDEDDVDGDHGEREHRRHRHSRRHSDNGGGVPMADEDKRREREIARNKQRRIKKRKDNIIEVLDSPEADASLEKAWEEGELERSANHKRKHKKHSNKEKEKRKALEAMEDERGDDATEETVGETQEPQPPAETKRKTPDDPELLARRAKILAADREAEMLKEKAREKLEARRRERNKNARDILSPSAVAASVTAGLHVIKRRKEIETEVEGGDDDIEPVKRKRSRKSKKATDEADGQEGSVDETGEVEDLEDAEISSLSSGNSAMLKKSNKSGKAKRKKKLKRDGVDNDDDGIEEEDDVVLLSQAGDNDLRQRSRRRRPESPPNATKDHKRRHKHKKHRHQKQPEDEAEKYKMNEDDDNEATEEEVRRQQHQKRRDRRATHSRSPNESPESLTLSSSSSRSRSSSSSSSSSASTRSGSHSRSSNSGEDEEGRNSARSRSRSQSRSHTRSRSITFSRSRSRSYHTRSRSRSRSTDSQSSRSRSLSKESKSGGRGGKKHGGSISSLEEGRERPHRRGGHSRHHQRDMESPDVEMKDLSGGAACLENEGDESASTVLDDRGVPLPNYYPGIDGCRSVEEFQCLNRIEEGTYGVVYRAKDKRTNEIVALKRLKMEKEKEGFPITSLREINTLLKGQHPNIVTVREIVVGSVMDKIYIVMDYVEHDLKSLMETMKTRKQSFLPAEVKCLTQQLLRAVNHLHDNWILHRDLKTSNLLLSHKGVLKVGDFGLAREYGSPLKKYTSLVVTLWYRAPELLLGSPEYSTPIDVWSVGCIFAEFLQMGPMFPGKSEIDQLNRIYKELGTPNERIWPGYKELPAVKNLLSQNSQFADYPISNVRKRFADKTSDAGISLLNGLLTYDPKQRLTAESALKHAYFEELPLPIDPSMFPTWPAKSELGSRKASAAAASSPKPPSGGTQFKQLLKDDAIPLSNSGGGNQAGGGAPAASLAGAAGTNGAATSGANVATGSGAKKVVSGIITGNKKSATNTGFVLNSNIEQRRVAMAPGFSLKF